MAAAILLIDLIYRKKCKNKAKSKLAIKTQVEINEKSSNTCRICLGEGKIKIFPEFSNENVAGDIKMFTGIEIVQDDDYPKFLCNSCDDLLKSAVKFRRLAHETERKLRMAERNLKLRKKKTIKERKLENKTEGPEKTTEKSEHLINEESDTDIMDNDTTWNDDVDSSQRDVYKCRKCKIVFTDSNKYLEHLDSAAHTSALKASVQRVDCEICQKRLVASYMKTHMIRKHSTFRPFVCEVCGKAFPARGAFDIHVRIHSDDLPFKCKECPYRGRDRYSVRLHNRVHTGERPFSCHLCPRQFARQQNFVKHLKSHKPGYDFNCDQCDRGFHTKKEITEHIRAVHMGLKEHVCDVCGREFAYRDLMIKHARRMHKVITRQPLYKSLGKDKLED